MLDLSPVKLLVILVVAMILLGPDKLPQVARQLGAAWRKLCELRARFDQEIRQSIPDLPSSQEIARLARSPLSLLNQLADFDHPADPVEDPVPGAGGSPVTAPGAAAPFEAPGDPSMN